MRSLLVSYLVRTRYARPRDIDIVVGTSSVDAIYERFAGCVHRKTRFGGLQIHQAERQFDLWPLCQTWAFVEDSIPMPSFEDLPETTFFNLEAIAVELWPSRGKAREIYSGMTSSSRDSWIVCSRSTGRQIHSRNSAWTSSLVLAHGIRFRIGPRLAAYIAREGIGSPPERFRMCRESTMVRCG